MKPRHLIILALLAGAWAAMPASGGYLVDSSGAVVRNSYGECWRTGSWTPAQAIAECDPELVVKKITTLASAPAPFPPPPEPKAAPSMAAPRPVPAWAPKAAAKAKSMGPKAVQKNGGGYGITALSVQPDTAAISILEHRWAPILEKGAEGRNFPDYGMYTYVLFGRAPTSLDDQKRYDATLAAVLQSPSESALPSSMQTRGATNLFCLPANQNFVSESKFNLKTYDYQIAQQYLIDFRFLLAGDKAILQRLVKDAGPFLIATLRPLGSIVKTAGGQMKIADAKAPILFIDLTQTHEKVIAEMVDAFKLEVIDTKMDRRQRFWSLRVALINLLKNADDQVTPVRQAVAGFIQKEEKKTPPKPASR